LVHPHCRAESFLGGATLKGEGQARAGASKNLPSSGEPKKLMDFSRPSCNPWRWLTLLGKRGKNLLSEAEGRDA